MGNTGRSVAAMPAGIPARSIVSCARRALGTMALEGSTLEAGLSLQPWGVADAVGMQWHLGARLVPIHGEQGQALLAPVPISLCQLGATVGNVGRDNEG